VVVVYVTSLEVKRIKRPLVKPRQIAGNHPQFSSDNLFGRGPVINAPQFQNGTSALSAKGFDILVSQAGYRLQRNRPAGREHPIVFQE
jgi:hypothetical protein